ncbi:MAG: hypothetical protein KC912_13625 [Proteobacteria bacterium]|nr:hypothetical protein [Pseudomonadota bacterium]
MSDPLYILIQGGPMAMAALAIGLLGIPFAALMAWAIGFMKWRLPASIGWLPSTLAITTASLGVFLFTNHAYQAMSASPEMRMTLLASAIAGALSTLIVATGVAALGFGTYALAAPIPAIFAVGPGGQFNLASLVSSLGGAVFGVIASSVALFVLIGTDGLWDLGPALFIMPPIAGLFTVAIFFSSLRESDEREHQGRIAGARTAIVIAAAMTLVLLGQWFQARGIQQAFEAVAMMPPEMKSTAMAAGIDIARGAGRLGFALTLMPLLAGLGGLRGVLGRVDTPEFVGAALGGLQIVVILSGLGIATGRLQSVFDLLMGQL